MDTETEDVIYDQLITVFSRLPDRLLRKLYIALCSHFEHKE